MTETGRFATRPWTPADDEVLRSLALNGVDPREIGRQLNRTGVAVRSRAARLNILLKKTKRKRLQNGRPSTVRLPSLTASCCQREAGSRYASLFHRARAACSRISLSK